MIKKLIVLFILFRSHQSNIDLLVLLLRWVIKHAIQSLIVLTSFKDFWWLNYEGKLSAFMLDGRADVVGRGVVWSFVQFRCLAGWTFQLTCRLILLQLLIGQLSLFDLSLLPVTAFSALDSIHDLLERDLYPACISNEFVYHFLWCFLCSQDLNHRFLECLCFFLHL